MPDMRPTSGLEVYALLLPLLQRLLRTTVLQSSNLAQTCCSIAQSDNGYMRLSTVEAHPNFSEAPHLRSSIPLPENWLQQKSNCTPTNNPMAPGIQ